MSNLVQKNNEIIYTVSLQDIIRSLPPIDKHLETFFIGEDREKLYEILAKLSIPDITHLFISISSFFEKRFAEKPMTLIQIEELDLKQLAYEFANQLNIPVPLVITEVERQEFKDILSKLGRVMLHEFVFPLILEECPEIAVSVKNLIKRSIASVCIIEGINKVEVFDMLQLEELPVERPIGYLNPVKPHQEIIYITTKNEKTNGSAILVCNHLSEDRKKYLSILLKQYGVCKGWRPFYNLIDTNGKSSQIIKVNPEKINLLLRVIFLLNQKKTESGKRYISLNKGKGLWDFLQQYLINEKTDDFFKRAFRKISSETNREKEHLDVRNSAERILKEVLEVEENTLKKIIAKEDDNN